jgi:hypothetical protein
MEQETGHGGRHMLKQRCVVIERAGAHRGKQGLEYFEGVSAQTAGSKALCMHVVTIPPLGRAKPHLHESHDSAVLSTETYGHNGNATVSGARTFAYAFENRLKSMNGGAVTLQYDGDGNSGEDRGWCDNSLSGFFRSLDCVAACEMGALL